MKAKEVVLEINKVKETPWNNGHSPQTMSAAAWVFPKGRNSFQDGCTICGQHWKGQITPSVTSPRTLTPLCYLFATLRVFGWISSVLLCSCPSLMALQKQTGAWSLSIYLCQPKHTEAVCACCVQGRDYSKPALHFPPLHKQV